MNLAQRAKAARNIVDVARHHVPDLRERGNGDYWGCCPFHEEHTPSFHVIESTGTFHCFGCAASGDVISLVQRLEGLSFGDACRRLLGDAPATRSTLASTAKRSSPTRPPPKRPPPAKEVAAFLETLCCVDDDPEVARYLHDRGLDARVVASRITLAAALPEGAPCPSWAVCGGRDWSVSPYRLVFPLYRPGSDGIVAFRARSIDPTHSPKSIAGKGIPTRNQVLADVLGRHLLAKRSLPSCWPVGERLRVVVCEGDIDFLTLATYWPDEHPSPAVFGVVVGSWTEAIAECIPSGSLVELRTDPDETGDRLALQIAETLRSRCDVQRVLLNGPPA